MRKTEGESIYKSFYFIILLSCIVKIILIADVSYRKTSVHFVNEQCLWSIVVLNLEDRDTQDFYNSTSSAF